jgi:hypothetical protein
MAEPMDAALRQQVARRAGGRCEYCGLPERFSAHRHEPDHIIAQQHGGETRLDNLALACLPCNRHKGPNIATIDPVSGKLTALFNPRKQSWHDHFSWAGATMVANSPVGRATLQVLKMNDHRRLMGREALIRANIPLFPGHDSSGVTPRS